MRVAFRVDASQRIGSGHLARCLNLAGALAERGARCQFVCRIAAGEPPQWFDPVRQRGFELTMLPVAHDGAPDQGPHAPAHADWLACGSAIDARDTRAALGNALARARIDWIIVDHYALDRRWAQALRGAARKLMVIDDLADRDHDCDLLLDQNQGRAAADYAARVPPHCKVLTGPHFALLGAAFAGRRKASLARRGSGTIRRILVAMGGVDAPNATGSVLDALARTALPPATHIEVILGAQAPWRADVERRAARLPAPVSVAVGVDDMADRMLAADLAIGAAGGSAWERCTLGLPSIVIVLAENQRPGAAALERAGAARQIADPAHIQVELPACLQTLFDSPGVVATMSVSAAALTDGLGAGRVAQSMWEAFDA